VWFALDGNDPESMAPESMAVEHVLARLEAVVRFANDLARGFGDAGLGTSLGEVLGVYRTLRTALDDIPTEQVLHALDDARSLVRGVTAIAQRLEELARLRKLLGP
jgi:hypothetical protein